MTSLGRYEFLAAVRRYRAGGVGVKATLSTLAEYAGERDGTWSCFPSQQRLADETEQSVRTVRRQIDGLVESGVIVSVQRNTGTGRTSNLYVFVLDVLLTPADSVTGGPQRTPDAAHRSPETDPSGHLVTDELLVELPPEGTTSSTAVDTDEAAQQFEHFWNVYPRRNGKRTGRPEALAQFRRLSLDDRRAAYRGAQHYAAAVDAGATIAADGHRWLRKRSFEDWQTPAVISTPRRQSKSDRTASAIENVRGMIPA